MTTHRWLQPKREAGSLYPDRQRPSLSQFSLLMLLTLTATVGAVPLCFLSLISSEESSKQTAWWD